MAKQEIRVAVPPRIREMIATDLRDRGNVAHQAWESAPTSEDVLTGDLGSSLRSAWSDLLSESGFYWRWRVTYRKFGAGNQHSSEEHPLGADGIFQIEVKRFFVSSSPLTDKTYRLENVEADYEFHKGMLFQAKRFDASDTNKLFSEVSNIESLTPGDGAYVEYGPNSYRACLAKDVVSAKGMVSKIEDDRFFELGDFLADRFVECLVGVEGMYVDLKGNPQILNFPDGNDGVRKLNVRLGHALSVQVTAYSIVPFVTQESL